MSHITLTYENDDPTPEHISALARRWNIAPEQVLRRAIAEFLGEHCPPVGLPPGVEPPADIRGLFGAHGLLKS